jgi:hypothetical protein
MAVTVDISADLLVNGIARPQLMGNRTLIETV